MLSLVLGCTQCCIEKVNKYSDYDKHKYYMVCNKQFKLKFLIKLIHEFTRIQQHYVQSPLE